MQNRIIITTYPAYTGIGKYVYDLMQYGAIETKTYSLCFKKSSDKKYYGETYFGQLRLPFFSGWYLNTRFQRLGFSKLYQRLNRNHIKEESIFHYCDYGARAFTEIPYSILTIHDFFHVSDKYRKYNYKPQNYLLRNLNSFKKFENLIADSKHVSDEAGELGFEHTPTVIYPPVSKYISPGLDKSKCRKKHSLPTDKTLILSVSSDDPRKNTKTVIETLEKLGTEYALVRIGPAIDGAYNFNNLPESEMNEIYNACDVLLLPTLDEGFGYPLVEAMSAGLPVVSSNIDVVEEVCDKAAILVEPTSTGCVNGVKEALANRNDLTMSGFERSKNFTVEVFHKNLERYYSNLNR